MTQQIVSPGGYADFQPLYSAENNQLTRGAALATTGINYNEAMRKLAVQKAIADADMAFKEKQLAQQAREWAKELEIARKQAKKSRRHSLLKGIISGIATIGGAAFGGPIGATAGNLFANTLTGGTNSTELFPNDTGSSYQDWMPRGGGYGF